MRGLWAFVVVFGGILSASSSSADGIRILPNEEGLFYWGRYRLPSALHVSRMERLLNQVAEAIEGIGYRHMGEAADFNHGHLLIEERGAGAGRELYARGILYHTQESAYASHWQGADPKFDYIDPRSRNWIQWLDENVLVDGRRIENARVYLDGTRKDPGPFFHGVPTLGNHFTIHAHQLDDKLLGFKLLGSVQFYFHKSGCQEKTKSGYEQGPVRVGVHCLILEASDMLVLVSTFRS